MPSTSRVAALAASALVALSLAGCGPAPAKEEGIEVVSDQAQPTETNEDEVHAVAPEPEPQAPQEPLSAEQAAATAFENAQVAEDQVQVLSVNYDESDNHYDVTFTVDGVQYDYDIDASTGAVIVNL